MEKIEIFFDTAQRLAQSFKASYMIKPFKTLFSDEHFIIAINEPKELIAIYNTKKATLNVSSFHDGQANLLTRNSNIQLLQCEDGNENEHITDDMDKSDNDP
ncbi:11382_t:CDS:2, partial [Funneliformis mosseae]